MQNRNSCLNHKSLDVEREDISLSQRKFESVEQFGAFAYLVGGEPKPMASSKSVTAKVAEVGEYLSSSCPTAPEFNPDFSGDFAPDASVDGKHFAWDVIKDAARHTTPFIIRAWAWVDVFGADVRACVNRLHDGAHHLEGGEPELQELVDEFEDTLKAGREAVARQLDRRNAFKSS